MPTSDARFISRLTRKTAAVVLAGGRGSRLGVLTDWRTKPAVPFAGKLRIIDFTLSNCYNSSIPKVCVLTQYKSHSLIQHLMNSWTFLNSGQQDFLDLVPAQQWVDDDAWYLGTADAVYQTLDILRGYDAEYVLVLAGDHVYTMDYGAILGTHAESDADFTIACIKVPLAEATEFGVMKVDDTGRITGFQEKPADPEPLPGDPHHALCSMGIYTARFDFLERHLCDDAASKGSSHDFGKDMIPRLLDQGFKIQSHTFTSSSGDGAYWRDVGTIDAYFQANMEQLAPSPPISLHDPTWQIIAHQPQLPPAHMTGAPGSCCLGGAMVSGGCVVDSSSLTNTILFSNVMVEQHCELDGVLALPGSYIGEGCRLTNVILDNACHLPAGTVIGENPEEDAKRYDVTPAGITVVNRAMLGQGSHYVPGVGKPEQHQRG